MNFDNLRLPKHIKKQIEQNVTNQMVCTRFPPEPSGGSIHLGHLFAARLNQAIAVQYGGKFLVRFDDTNPSSECKEYEDAILKDLENCGFNVSNLSYTSDSFDMLIEKATELIASGNAYVDNSTQDQISSQRKNMTASTYRDRSIDDNLFLWSEMQAFDDLTNQTTQTTQTTQTNQTNVCLRLKAYPTSKNGAMRDPVLYRIINLPHHRTKNKYKICISCKTKS